MTDRSESRGNVALIVFLLIWAGACIGANMIAAPAKFQVVELAQPLALQVGRVQFQWVGYLEYFLAGLAAMLVITAPKRTKVLVAIAIALFIGQRLLILPQLSERTDQVIAGVVSHGSHLHMYFIICELSKIIAIIAGALTALSAITGSSTRS